MDHRDVLALIDTLYRSWPGDLSMSMTNGVLTISKDGRVIGEFPFSTKQENNQSGTSRL